MSKLGKLVWILWTFTSSLAYSQVSVQDRHVMILYSGVDAIWGNYLFMISNPGSEAERFRSPVLLPKETSEWQAQDNLSAEELILGEDGGLIMDKLVAPGDHLISLGFKLAASSGKSSITLDIPFEIGQLGFFVGDPELSLDAQGFSLREDVPFSGRSYDTYTRNDLKASSRIEATISGVPEGRLRFWVVGSIAAFLVATGGFFAAWKSRPQGEEKMA